MMYANAQVHSVHILDEFQTEGHRLVIFGRDFTGRRVYLGGDSEWHEVTEAGAMEEDGGRFGNPPTCLVLPVGVLDAIVAKYHGTTAPQPATERHLEDTIALRDRLLTLLERA